MITKEFKMAAACVTTIRQDHYRAEVTEYRTGLTSWADFPDFDAALEWAVEGAKDYDMDAS